MPTFVILNKWTDKSFEVMKDHTIGEKIKKVIQEMGAEIKGWYMLMGQYDEICILEAPDAETVDRIVIALTAQYGGKSETLRAFSADEVKKLCPSQGK
jgi:uncharacterized protein with GYD domain